MPIHSKHMRDHDGDSPDRDLKRPKRSKTVARHSDAAGWSVGVWSVAFSPDGQWIVTGTDDRFVRVYELQTGELIRRLSNRGPTTCARFSPDGQCVASAAENVVKIWWWRTGQERMILEGHKDSVNSVEFSADGNQVVTTSEDKTAKVWDVASGECVQTLVHTGRLLSAKFSADGEYVATASKDKNAQVWKLATGSCVQTLADHKHWVKSVQFSRDGKYLLTNDYAEAKVWKWEEGTCKRTLPYTKCGYWAEFDAHDRWVVMADGDKTASVFDWITGERIHKLEGRHTARVMQATFNADSTRVVTAGDDGSVELWELAASAETA